MCEVQESHSTDFKAPNLWKFRSGGWMFPYSNKAMKTSFSYGANQIDRLFHLINFADSCWLWQFNAWKQIEQTRQESARQTLIVLKLPYKKGRIPKPSSTVCCSKTKKMPDTFGYFISLKKRVNSETLKLSVAAPAKVTSSSARFIFSYIISPF